MEDSKIISIIRHKIMHDDEASLHEALFRQSQGNKVKAYEIIRASAEHYGLTKEEVSDFHIEHALAELNDGCEFEGWID